MHKSFTLSNGVTIPAIGFGTAPLKGEEAYLAVREALRVGYRHIDTAAIYGNEEAVAQALQDSKVPRSEVFITSKLDASIKDTERALSACEDSLRRLQMDTLDLYLIHAPWPWDQKFSDHAKGNVAAYRALEALYRRGKVRAIGVSNFDVNDLKNILENTSVTPHVNQIKFHIGYPQDEIRAFCARENILIEAYSPFGRGALFHDPTFLDIAAEHGISPAALAIQYILHKGALPLPRSAKPANIQANLVADVSLSEATLERLDRLRVESIEFGTPIKT